MSAYRFCRTDDIPLLSAALNHCWGPAFPDDPPVTPAAFKRSIRDLQVWCSSCMVAFADAEPIGVLIGAKRAGSTLVHRIAVHPQHRRQGHARHLLASLGSKLAILGPPRIVAEVPEVLDAACALFDTSGYLDEGLLTDYVWDADGHDTPNVTGRFVIPVTVDDLAANGLLEEAGSGMCWERSTETITARKAEIGGLAVASDERLEAFILYSPPAPDAEAQAEIVSLRGLVDDDGDRAAALLGRLALRGMRTLTYPRVHPSEISAEGLTRLGFRPVRTCRLYAAGARAS